MCQLREASTPWHKRYLNGPRLASELPGSARRLILGKPANWLSEHGGTEVLLEHLRIGLKKPQLSELSDYLQKYFRQSKRRPGESMGDYVTKKCEVYLRAQQAYHRVKPHHTPNRTSTRAATAPAGYTGRRNSWESDASTPNPTTDGNDTGGDDASTAATTTEQATTPGGQESTGGRPASRPTGGRAQGGGVGPASHGPPDPRSLWRNFCPTTSKAGCCCRTRGWTRNSETSW